MKLIFTNKLIQIALLGAFFLISNISRGQLIVDQSYTPAQLVNDFLLGEGVEATNITFNGVPADSPNVQIGYFNSEASNVPFATGILMGTGDVLNAIGPNNSGSSSLPSVTPAPSDSDLYAIINPIGTEFPITVNDNAILEFDFVPNGDTVSFNFVFASEEYNEYVCGTVNDVFGFFISGPGINGPFSNDAENIALVPGTDIPVSINTVNNGTVGSNGSEPNCSNLDPNWTQNSVYFVDNENNPDPTSMQYDGSTVSMRAFIPVQCGETYHIKLAIADGSDTGFDSGVFLEEGSFSSVGTVAINITPTIGGAAVTDSTYAGVLVEGCSTAEIYLVRPDTAGTLEGSVTLSGNAIYGEEGEGDYILVGDTMLEFAAGQDTLVLTILTHGDEFVNEGDSIIISVTTVNSCGIEQTFSDWIPIVDPYPITSETEDVYVVCPLDSVPVYFEGHDGINPYTGVWSSNISLTDTIIPYIAVPEDSVTVYVNITDACGLAYSLDSVTVYNNIPPPLDLSIEQPEIPLCPGDAVEITAVPVNGLPAYAYDWSEGTGGAITNTVNFLVTDTVYLTVFDQCGTEVSDSVIVEVPVYEPVTASLDSIVTPCPNDLILLSPEFDGGSGVYTYEWNSGATTSTLQDTPFGTTEYTFTVTDQCNESVTVSNQVIINYVPLTAGRTLGNANCDGTELILGVDSLQGGLAPYEYQWQRLDGTSIDFIANDTTTGNVTIASPENTPYIVTVSDNCPGSNYPALVLEYNPEIVKLSNIMNVITPNGDGKNDRFYIDGIEFFPTSKLEVYDRWGKSVFSASSQINSWDAEDLTDGTYFYILTIDNGECEKTGYFEVLGSN